MFCERIDEKTKQVFGLTTRKYNGYIEVGDIEQAYNGAVYLKGYAPEKSVEEKQAEVRAVRNQYLEQTDKYLSVSDFPIDEETKEQYRLYRQYLRDYPETENWYESNPLRFDEWKGMVEEK